MKLGKTPGERTCWSWWTRLPLICLLLGLFTALGLAAGSALWFPVRAGDGWSRHSQAVRPRDAARGEGSGSILVDKWSRPGALFFEVWVTPSTGGSSGSPTDARRPEELLAGWPRWGQAEKMPWGRAGVPWPEAGRTEMRFLEARGWPFPLAWCEYTVDWNSNRGAQATASGAWTTGGETVLKGSSRAIHYERAVPRRLITSGVAADMAIFGAAWFALFRSVHALRRRAWNRRGLCIRCGHECVPGPERRCGECRWVNGERAAA